MTPTDRFRACGEALFGSTWQTELARALDLSPESGIVRKMASGRANIAQHTWRKLADLMRDRRVALQALAPLADPHDAGAEHIRAALTDPRAEIRAGCLIGMGHWQLGADLDEAAHALVVARRRLADLPMREMTPAEREASPFFADTFQDAEAGAAAERELFAAQARLGELDAQARAIADALDHGYDGAPC